MQPGHGTIRSCGSSKRIRNARSWIVLRKSVKKPCVPLLDGLRETVAAGIFSSLQPQNVRLRRAIRNLDEAAAHPLYPVLFDPQTGYLNLQGQAALHSATLSVAMAAMRRSYFLTCSFKANNC